ncbi:MAG: helix-turn-helix domain-containing protein [Bacteroidota bacterium]
MDKAHKDEMVEFFVLNSEEYIDARTALHENIEKFSGTTEIINYLERVSGILKYIAIEIRIFNAANPSLQDGRTVNIFEETVNKLSDYVKILRDKYFIMDELLGTEKELQTPLVISAHQEQPTPDLLAAFKQKTNKVLTENDVEDLKSIFSEVISKSVPQTSSADDTEILLKRKDVAKLFSVSLKTVHDWMKSGKLPVHRINSRVFFKKSEIYAVLEAKPKLGRKKNS